MTGPAETVINRLVAHFEIVIEQHDRDEASAFSAESRVSHHIASIAFHEALQAIRDVKEGKSLSTEIGRSGGYIDIRCARCGNIWSQLTSEPSREVELCGDCEEKDLMADDVTDDEGIRADSWKALEDR